MSLEDFCASVNFLLQFFLACFHGFWPSLSFSPPERLWLPGTCSQPHEPGALCRQTSIRLQTHNLEGSRNHHSLFLIIGQRDPIKHLEWSKVAWPRLVLWVSVPCMVCQKMRLGTESGKGQGMGWCSSTCGERPGISTSFCGNCQEGWCPHRAQSAPSNPAVPAWPWWPLGGPGPGHDLGHEHQDLPLCHVQQLPGKGVFFRPFLYRGKKLIKQISLDPLRLWLRNFQFYPFIFFQFVLHVSRADFHVLCTTEGSLAHFSSSAAYLKTEFMPIMQIWTLQPRYFLNVLKVMQLVSGRVWNGTESDFRTQVGTHFLNTTLCLLNWFFSSTFSFHFSWFTNSHSHIFRVCRLF